MMCLFLFVCFSYRKWIDSSELSVIDYVIKAFNDSWVKDKIPDQDMRKDLSSPVSILDIYRHPATIIAYVIFASFEMPNSLDKLPNSPA